MKKIPDWQKKHIELLAKVGVRLPPKEKFLQYLDTLNDNQREIAEEMTGYLHNFMSLHNTPPHDVQEEEKRFAVQELEPIMRRAYKAKMDPHPMVENYSHPPGRGRQFFHSRWRDRPELARGKRSILPPPRGQHLEEKAREWKKQGRSLRAFHGYCKRRGLYDGTVQALRGLLDRRGIRFPRKRPPSSP